MHDNLDIEVLLKFSLHEEQTPHSGSERVLYLEQPSELFFATPVGSETLCAGGGLVLLSSVDALGVPRGRSIILIILGDSS